MPWFPITTGSLVEKGAGQGSGFSDQEYQRAGADLVEKAEDVWAEADLVIKVKEPLGAGIFPHEAWAGVIYLPSPGRRSEA